MKWETHALLGASWLWPLTFFLRDEITPGELGILVLSVGIGALLPDLDAADSKLNHVRIVGVKPLAFPSMLLHQTLGHRGLLHSLLGLYLVLLSTIIATLWWGWLPSVALVLGYASHLMADACTRSGIPLLYPNPQRYHLLPSFGRIATGSPLEDMLGFALAAAVFMLFMTWLPLV